MAPPVLESCEPLGTGRDKPSRALREFDTGRDKPVPYGRPSGGHARFRPWDGTSPVPSVHELGTERDKPVPYGVCAAGPGRSPTIATCRDMPM